MTKTKTVGISVRAADKELWDWAKEYAKQERMSLSAVIAKAVQKLKDAEGSKDGND